MSTITFRLGSTGSSSPGLSRPSLSTVWTANQYSPSRGARKVKEGRSGVVTLTGSQWYPVSFETQS